VSNAIGRQWLFNRGYGAIGGAPTPPERDNVARFSTEGGVPLVWGWAGLGAAAALLSRRSRWPAAACGAWLAWQLVFWGATTHLQSRFLITTLLPGVGLIGLGTAAVLDRLPASRRVGGGWVAAALVVLPIWAVALSVVWSQTPASIDPAGRRVQYPVAMVVDAWPLSPRGVAPLHPVNALPPDSRTLIVADNSRLLYIDRPFAYATAFDPDPLGRIVRSHGPAPANITAALRREGFTHVYLGRSELARLRRTYGYDPGVTPALLDRLVAAGWRQVGPQIYALPAVSPTPSPSPD